MTSKRVSVNETRYDPRDLAVIAQALKNNIQVQGSKSSLIAEGLHILARVLIKYKRIEPIETASEALEILAKLGYGSKANRGNRGAKLLDDLLELETLIIGDLDSGDPISSEFSSIAEDAVRKIEERDDP